MAVIKFHDRSNNSEVRNENDIVLNYEMVDSDFQNKPSNGGEQRDLARVRSDL